MAPEVARLIADVAFKASRTIDLDDMLEEACKEFAYQIPI